MIEKKKFLSVSLVAAQTGIKRRTLQGQLRAGIYPNTAWLEESGNKGQWCIDPAQLPAIKQYNKLTREGRPSLNSLRARSEFATEQGAAGLPEAESVFTADNSKPVLAEAVGTFIRPIS